MKTEKFSLREDRPSVCMTAYLPEKCEKLPVVLVVPGGAYIACSDTEGHPVAQAFAEMGYCACVLEYSTLFESFDSDISEENADMVSAFPRPLLELGKAMLLIGENAERWGADGDKIVLCGFSAGGHLAACHGTLWHTGETAGALGVEAEKLRPAGQILCYPSIDMQGKTNPIGRIMNLAIFRKAEPSPEEVSRLNPIEQVSGNTPPTFIWHSAEDTMVSCRDSMAMAAALLDSGVSCEAHIFPTGPHAIGAAKNRHCGQWMGLADKWIRRFIAK